MSFLKNLFADKEERTLAWKNLNTEADIADVVHRSYKIPCAVFKHSTRCSISDMVKNRLEKNFNLPEDKVEMYFLDLIRHRVVSNHIADFFSVRHESPQIIVIKDGKAIYHSSHTDITLNNLSEALQDTSSDE